MNLFWLISSKVLLLLFEISKVTTIRSPDIRGGGNFNDNSNYNSVYDDRTGNGDNNGVHLDHNDSPQQKPRKRYPNLSDFKVYKDTGAGGYQYSHSYNDESGDANDRKDYYERMNRNDWDGEEERFKSSDSSTNANFLFGSSGTEEDVFGKGHATGLEFGKGKKNPFKIDEDFFFKPMSPRDPRVYFGVIRKFIRNAKGLPMEIKEEPYRLKTVNESVQWSFLPYHLSKLAKIEFRIYTSLKLFTFGKDYKQSKSPIPVLDSYLKDFERSSFRAYVHVNVSNSKKPDKEKEGPFFYIGTHPTLVHMMIRRFAEDLPEIMPRLTDKKLIAKLNTIYEDLGFQFPTYKDLDESLESLVRLQTMANIRTIDLALGRFHGLDTSIRVNALQAMEIGGYFIKSEIADLALLWLNYGLRLVEASAIGQRFPVFINMFEMCHGYAAEMNNVLRTFLRGRYPFTYFTNNVTYPFIPNRYVRMWDTIEHHIGYYRLDLLETAQNLSNYGAVEKEMYREMNIVHSQLCAGYNYQTAEEKLPLRCWLETKLNYYWAINPLKIELLNVDPPVVMVYDFMGNILREVLRNLAVDRLERSSVYGGINETLDKGKQDNSRTSYQAWLETNPNDDNVITDFSKRIKLLTGMNILTRGASEMYQVAVYGSSHHFGPHIDNPGKLGETLNTGSRLTTVMGYLTDVRVGGRTAFPVLGFAAKAVKGALLMWDNTLDDLYHQDYRTMHGGCPVIFGTKWIVNKWISDGGNTFTYKCGKNSPNLFLSNLKRRFKSELKLQAS